nr:hypothetical protein [Nostoc sphaeroides]
MSYELGTEVLSLPIWPELADHKITEITKALRAAIAES